VSAPPRPVRRSALAEQVRIATRLDRTQSDPIVSARNALGVALPLVIGAVHGDAALGLASTIGALQTAFADRPGPYRLRLFRMAGCALAAGLTSSLAVCFSRSEVGSALLVLVLAFCAGLLLSGGPSAAQLGVAATGCALVIGHTPQSPSVAVHVGLLVFAGGAIQLVLAIAAWPLGRHAPERRALAGLYGAIAAMARRPPSTGEGPPLAEQLAEVRATLYGMGHDHGPSVEAYRVLMDEASRIRREVLVLGAQAERLDREEAHESAAAVRTVLGAAAVVLDQVAAALQAGRLIDEAVLGPVRVRVDEVVTQLDNADAGGGELTRRAAAARIRSLTGQLRAAIETSRAGASEGARAEPGLIEVNRDRLRTVVSILRANLTPDSALLRHAIRLAVLIGGSDLVVRAAGLSRGYWIPLTIMVVLRPDFGGTFQRGVMRILGTVVGLLLATGLVHFGPGGQWYLIVLCFAFFFAMRFAGPGNVGLSAVGLSSFVVVLLALAGVAPHSSVGPRSLDTVIGGGLALAATLLWPVWERRLLPGRLAELLAAYRAYLLTIVDPGADAGLVHRARAASRLARGNARASVDRARAEPVAGRAEVELGEAVLVHSHRLVNAMLTVDAVRTTLHDSGWPPELVEFMQQAADALARCEESVRSGHAPRGVIALRPAQERVAAALWAEPERAGDAQTAGAIVDATDRMANSLDTLASELRRQLPT
jgi:uncharacterized membrane protein YccC